jgi:hypothetical protein
MIHPRSFIAEYVDPALALWRKDQNAKHLAAHTIAQIDVLAEIVALWTLLAGRRTLGRDEARKFRDCLGVRQPALAIIRDAHDSHKHGALDRITARAISQGQRPEVATGYGIFLDVTPLDGPPTPLIFLVLVLNDGTEKRVDTLLREAMEAWGRELTRLGL